MSAISSVLILGGFKIHSPQIKGKVIQATMVDISQLKPRTEDKKTAQQPEKKQPVKKDPPKQQPVAKKPPPQVEKPKEQKPTPKKDPPRIVKKTPVVDTKAQELERKKSQERKKKLDEIRQKRIAAEKRAKQEQQNLIDLANKTKETETNTETVPIVGTKNGQSEVDEQNRLMGQYQLAVISSVKRQWNKPASANQDLVCHVEVRQIIGGGVIDATIGSPCNANSIVKKSIIAAITKADPLPYKGFESVFSRTATFIFTPPKD
ncbi:MAG: hypothetical protein AB8B80_13000 [Marinicellaceae bacterium]